MVWNRDEDKEGVEGEVKIGGDGGCLIGGGGGLRGIWGISGILLGGWYIII